MASFTITDVCIFTGTSTISSGFVSVENGKIAAIGEGSPPSSSGKTISKPGHTLIPGLIDAHIHADKGNPLGVQQSIRFGVTTVMDMHNEPVNVRKLKKMAEDKQVSDFKSCSLAATIENGWPVPVVTAHDKSPETMAEIATWPRLTNEKDVEEYMEARMADGADYIKLMHESGKSMGWDFSYPTQELQEMIIKAAHKRGKVAVCHALAMPDTITVLNAGVDGLTHTFYDQAPTQELVDAYKKNNAWCNPTLAAVGSLTKEGLSVQEKFAHDKRADGKIGEPEKERLCMCMNFKAQTAKLEYAYESVRVLKNAGIDIVCGSDAAGPALGTAYGLSMHQELYSFVTYCGFTPEEALRSATYVTAKRFGFPDRGQIKEGLKADLVLIEGNPLEDINKTLDLRGVWRDGELHQMYAENL